MLRIKTCKSFLRRSLFLYYLLSISISLIEIDSKSAFQFQTTIIIDDEDRQTDWQN